MTEFSARASTQKKRLWLQVCSIGSVVCMGENKVPVPTYMYEYVL